MPLTRLFERQDSNAVGVVEWKLFEEQLQSKDIYILLRTFVHFKDDFTPNYNHFHVTCSGKLLLFKNIRSNYDNKIPLGDELCEL